MFWFESEDATEVGLWRGATRLTYLTGAQSCVMLMPVLTRKCVGRRALICR